MPVCETNSMPSSPQGVFGPFRLDPEHTCLWCATQAIPLPLKVFAVLHYLVTHPDRLVTKDELLDAVWPKIVVSDAVVRVAIGALRKVPVLARFRKAFTGFLLSPLSGPASRCLAPRVGASQSGWPRSTACHPAPGRTGASAVLRPAGGRQGARPAARRRVGEASGGAGGNRVGARRRWKRPFDFPILSQPTQPLEDPSALSNF